MQELVLRSIRSRGLAGVGAILAATAMAAPAHSSDIIHATVVSDNPADFTPRVIADSVVSQPTVLALAERNDTLFAGGRFESVASADGSTNYSRDNLVGFSGTTGAVLPVAPVIDGTVWAIEPRGRALYIGGNFTHVNGVARPGLAKINAASGQLIAKFDPQFAPGTITEIRRARGRLIVGGTYRGKLKAFDPKTGHDTGYLALAFEGSVASNAGATDVYRFSVSPNQRRLVAIGNFTSVDGVERWRAVMLNLGKNRAKLNEWSYHPLKRLCLADTVPNYLKDVDFAPDGSYFVLVASGFVPQADGVGTDICDAAARFETGDPAPSLPTWINYTGGDTLHSVAVSGAAVYVQGHQRWLDNPEGYDDPGPGAVDRPGIGAIDPATGSALAWNPGKSRGVGGKDMLLTAAGLWVGSDGEYFGNEYRPRIAFAPLP
ncbi:MAG: hypothetical protein ABI720_05910 [Actinomycetes bacterium]